ncbi:hypothetical protein BCR42DRAFT_422524 [Absidia repens]|uniref:Pentacotripeptide-repeat region of PRORP domain-containing protein n=1 Tax=Absidia repens TaxID=90262 RepID=A0A1X2I6V3_9FUNG|nr:hypothetical protein BCR42DRAFT_422524 [Absidia repens]
MSFPLLLQRQGVQLRSWHRVAPSRLLCRTCLLVRRQHQHQHTKPSLVFGSGSYSNGLNNGGHCRWNYLKQQQQSQQLYISSSFQPSLLQQQRHLHLITPEVDSRLQELVTLLSHPPVQYSQSSKSSSSLSNVIARRNYRKMLTTLYESIRRDVDVWCKLESHELLALYKALCPSVHDPSLSMLLVNAQHVLQDIQQLAPQKFDMVHGETLLSIYKVTGQVDEALDLVDWMKTKQLPLSLTAYEWLIATLTTTTRPMLTTKQQRPMDLALRYWNEAKVTMEPTSEATAAKLELMTGYMMQGFLAQGDLMRAASWLKSHTDSSNVAMQKVLDQWKTATSMGGDDRYYALGVVSYSLEKLIQQAAHLDRYSDARLFYRQQCRLFSSNNGDDKTDTSLLSGSMQQKQSTVGLVRLAERYLATNKDTMAQQILQDAVDLGHHKGAKVMSQRLLHHWLGKNKLRPALDLFFWMDTLEQTQQLPRSFDRMEAQQLLLRAAKSKYHTDMYRLYQRFATLYPASLDLRTYTHVLQTLIRTKQYDHARQVYQDAIHNPLLIFPTGSSVSTSAYTRRLFHLAYSLCAQLGDLDLFKSTLDIQWKVGLPGLHHHALTSLMATYVKIEDTASAKAVFDHLAHRLEQQPKQRQSTTPILSSTTPVTTMNSMHDYEDDDHVVGGFDGEQDSELSDVDVVDFNLLMRTIGVEHDEYLRRHQQEGEPVANRILEVLRHMNLVGVPLNITTLRTLLDVYKGKGLMEDEIFKTLLADPKATHHDDIWLNNLKLTRILYGGKNSDAANRNRRSQIAANKFLSNDRHVLFPGAPRGTSILANGMTYKILLDALTQHTETAHLAQRVYDHMRKRGWRPSVGVYERMVIVWSRKLRLQKAAAVMQDACDDLGWSTVPIKWYTGVLDRLMAKNRPDLAEKWVLQMKANKELSMDRFMKDRLAKYGLNDSSASTNSMATSHQQHH